MTRQIRQKKKVIFDLGLSRMKLTSFVIVYGLTKVSSQHITPLKLLIMKVTMSEKVNSLVKNIFETILELNKIEPDYLWRNYLGDN